MSIKKTISPSFEAKLLKEEGVSKDANAVAVADETGTIKVTVKSAHELKCSLGKFLDALEEEFGLCQSYSVAHAKARSTFYDWEFIFPPENPARNSAWLKKWLRENGSGIYRPCADAADRIDNLEKQRYLLAKLSAKEPQFANPMDAFAAQSVRDAVLTNPSC